MVSQNSRNNRKEIVTYPVLSIHSICREHRRCNIWSVDRCRMSNKNPLVVLFWRRRMLRIFHQPAERLVHARHKLYAHHLEKFGRRLRDNFHLKRLGHGLWNVQDLLHPAKDRTFICNEQPRHLGQVPLLGISCPIFQHLADLRILTPGGTYDADRSLTSSTHKRLEKIGGVTAVGHGTQCSHFASCHTDYGQELVEIVYATE